MATEAACKQSIKFIVEIIDPLTGCIVDEGKFELTNCNEIAQLLNIADFNIKYIYDLDSQDIEKLKAKFNLNFITGCVQGILRQQTWINNLPYQIHMHRELNLMLAGVKPFASFSEEYPVQSDFDAIPEKFFEPYVLRGCFVKHDYIELLPQAKIRRVLYALPHEEWRINTYILMRKTASIMGWNDGFERMEGYLLGYEDWQCDAYFEARKARRS